MKFRALNADEIEVRVQSIQKGKGKNKGKVYAIFLLYKDARCDMKILDETVGSSNWQRKHEEHNNNLFCSVGIYNAELKEWVWKEDAGTESNTSAEKGHASDSFKRACFNWGIGRELYTSPLIYFELKEGEYYASGTSLKTSNGAKFYIGSVGIDDGEIKSLTIKDKAGNVRFEKRG